MKILKKVFIWNITDIDEMEIVVNINNVAMIELPFIELENAIVRKRHIDRQY